MIELPTSKEEFKAYCLSGENTISDMDMGYNQETKEYDKPSIEWDSYMGRHWENFDTEEERQLSLDKYTVNFNAWIINYRAEKKLRYEIKNQEEKRLKKLKSLGNQFPQLLTLL
tara:strand:+ start:30048 stop:30389 length:342 start_codon:yes stop_codon:yes gene_type:complete